MLGFSLSESGFSGFQDFQDQKFGLIRCDFVFSGLPQHKGLRLH